MSYRCEHCNEFCHESCLHYHPEIKARVESLEKDVKDLKQIVKGLLMHSLTADDKSNTTGVSDSKETPNATSSKVPETSQVHG